MPLAHLTKLGPIAQTALPHSDRGYANFPSRYRPLTLCCASRVPLPAKGYAHADRCEAFGMRPGGGRRGNRENFEAVRIEFMLLVEPEEKLGRADPEQSRADHVREPVRVMSHTAEAVKQRERIDGRGYIPHVVVVLAHAGSQAEHRRDLPRDKRPATMERRRCGCCSETDASGRTRP